MPRRTEVTHDHLERTQARARPRGACLQRSTPVSAVPGEYPGWPRDEQAVAWLRAWLRGTRSGDAKLVALAQAELRALGVEVRAALSGVRP